MFLSFEDRPSDSPFIERVWRCRSERAGTFISIAASHSEMVVTRHHGKLYLTLRGPEIQASLAGCPAEGEWLGIRFSPGTYMRHVPPGALRDRNDITLPDAAGRSFWLNGSAWEYPGFENAETFVDRLYRKGILWRDAAVDAALRGDAAGLSMRSAQRHFLRATGMTQGTWRRIQRARHAANLLRQGFTALDTVHMAGYFDQAHLTRSLKHLIGQTPGEISRGDNQLSFLYKTSSQDALIIRS